MLMESWWIKFGVFWWFISSKKSWQVYKVTNVFKNLCYSNDTATCLFGIFPVLMWEYGHRLTCILCSSNIKRLHLGGCLSSNRCHQIHIAKETAEISVCNVCQGVFFYLFPVKRGRLCSKYSHWKFISTWEREKYIICISRQYTSLS